MLLERAEDLGRRMLHAFNTPSGLPYGTFGMSSGKKYNPAWAGGASTIAEVGTLQLEMRALSRHTGDPVYEAVAQRIMRHLRTMTWPDTLPRGVYPMFIHPTSGTFTSHEITLGARADSLYEYLLKQWLLSNKTDARVRRMYDDSVASIRAHLVRRGAQRCGNCTYIGQWNYKTAGYVDKMDHLVCFVPGMLALGAAGETAAQDIELAEELMDTCYHMYADTPTGLAPEIGVMVTPNRHAVHGMVPDGGAKHSLLRPETVESLFVLWRLTGKQRYREMGWAIFGAIEAHCRIPTGGYSGVKDVTAALHRLQYTGRMESFFTAETLKYLYLLFGDGTEMPLDSVVFNTEAHPLGIHASYGWGREWGSLPDLADAELDVSLAATAEARAAAERTRGLVLEREELLERLGGASSPLTPCYPRPTCS